MGTARPADQRSATQSPGGPGDRSGRVRSSPCVGMRGPGAVKPPGYAGRFFRGRRGGGGPSARTPCAWTALSRRGPNRPTTPGVPRSATGPPCGSDDAGRGSWGEPRPSTGRREHGIRSGSSGGRSGRDVTGHGSGPRGRFAPRPSVAASHASEPGLTVGARRFPAAPDGSPRCRVARGRASDRGGSALARARVGVGRRSRPLAAPGRTASRAKSTAEHLGSRRSLCSAVPAVGATGVPDTLGRRAGAPARRTSRRARRARVIPDPRHPAPPRRDRRVRPLRAERRRLSRRPPRSPSARLVSPSVSGFT